MGLLEAALAFPGYYFSFTYNLSQSIQRESAIPVRSDQPLLERVSSWTTIVGDRLFPAV